MADAPRPAAHVVVLVGALGDLSRRKLLPGLFRLYAAGLMPGDFRIVGTSRSGGSDEDFRAVAREAIGEDAAGEGWEAFARRLTFAAFRAEETGPLVEAVGRAEAELGPGAERLLYLSIPPGGFSAFVTALGASGLAEGARVIIEKPFGVDLDSARALNAVVHDVFAERQVFRIDHFLGREAVQNLVALRFANGMFEPVWNRDHIDHVQIDVPEALDVGERGTFYEETGAFRDMVVTHLFHVLGFVAMEPPMELDARSLEEETSKVFRALEPLRPEDAVRGQYDGYRDVSGVTPDSDTETFAAVRVHLDNWRWAGVPFFLRTGKRLAEGRRQITIAFREPPRRMFDVDGAFTGSFGTDHITFDLGDPGSIAAVFFAKVPGPRMRLGRARMSFSFDHAFGDERSLEAYERLLYDAMLGDRMLFDTSDGIERRWAAAAPLLESPPPVLPYAPGSWGPDAVHELIAPREWRLPS